MLNNTSLNGILQYGDITPMKSDMPEDDARSEATFDFVVKNLSRIKDAVLSEPCMILNLPWKIMAMQRPDNTANRSSSRSLGFFLQCNGEEESESSSWSCLANAQLSILSQKEGVEDFSRKIQHLFYSEENDWGFSHFMSWNDVMNPKHGYIKDDTIILRAVVTTDAPQGVSRDSKKNTRYVGLKNQVEATFDFIVENLSHIKDAVLSEPCMICNLPWKIMAMQRPDNTADRSPSKSLGFFLQCNGEEESESSSWSCLANAQLSILSQKEGVEDFSRKIRHLFYSEENDWGFSHFMSWNDVMNPKHGYIKDDIIILRAVVTTDAPQGVSRDSKKNTRYVGLKNQVEATFDFIVENLSHIKDAVLSEPCMICNLPWKIMAMQRPDNTADRSPSKSLGFFLQCNGEEESESSSWSCLANAQLSILSQKEGVEDFSRKIRHLFYSEENDWGFSHFMSWNDVMNPKHGYIKDDIIILRAVITADAPQGVSGDSKKHTRYVGLKNQVEATFDFVVENLSHIKDTVFSEPCMILNLPWKIMAMQRPDNTTDRSPSKSLGFFLQCNGEEESESSSWSCFANAQLSILSQKEGVEDFSRKIQHLFYSEENDWGFSHFMSWNDVMNPKHGYIKDDTIILRAVVTTDAPQGVSRDSKKNTRYVGLKNQVEATFDFVVENLSHIKDAVLSEPCMICNLPWKIMAMQRPDNTGDRSPSKSLGFFLQCNGEREGDLESSSWSCFANAQLIILSQKEGVEDFSRKIQHLFYSEENDWGFSHFMSWNDVMNPKHGYIKDDTIILRAIVTVDAPHSVSWDKKHTR
ncbi:uncharacterized protein LOC135847481 [Planococcus citri]|uniref:uncharacterized protein LOC135847481 n=1 Tax=Planococcus citri TaxID=170843 RepID=UPI0031F9F49D